MPQLCLEFYYVNLSNLDIYILYIDPLLVPVYFNFSRSFSDVNSAFLSMENRHRVHSVSCRQLLLVSLGETKISIPGTVDSANFMLGI